MFMNNTSFGVEIEFGGITRKAVANLIASHPFFMKDVSYIGGAYSQWNIYDINGNKWKVVYDSSVNYFGAESCELVTPVLSGNADIKLLQEIVTMIRNAGAMIDESCGIHVHVSHKDMTPKALRRLVIQWANKEDAVLYGVQTIPARLESFCKTVDNMFLNSLISKSIKTYKEISDFWYMFNTDIARTNTAHYHKSRYHSLNLHSFFTNQSPVKDIEFRLFNGTLDEEKITAYIQYCCAVVNHAVEAHSAKYSKMPINKANLADWFTRIGLVGTEYKICRKHMLAGFAN